MGAEVDYQVAAPTEMRTPNLHRANHRSQRVRMEGWRQRRPGSKAKNTCKQTQNRLDSHRPSHGRTWLQPVSRTATAFIRSPNLAAQDWLSHDMFFRV